MYVTVLSQEAKSEVKVNGECGNLTDKDESLAPDQMTSADYYFDSYAHFGKEFYILYWKRDFSLVLNILLDS